MNKLLIFFSNNRFINLIRPLIKKIVIPLMLILAANISYANDNISEEQIIYLILQNNQEYAIHNMMGHEGNQVYIHPTKGYEVVKDKDGNILKDHFTLDHIIMLHLQKSL